MSPRPYALGKRAEAAEARRNRIVHATIACLGAMSYDEMTLQDVADRAEVSLKTVIRLFGTREGLVSSLLPITTQMERKRREVAPGDVRGAVGALAARYEELSGWVIRRIAMEQRFEEMRRAGDAARASHLGWLEEVFAEWLPPRRGPVRRRRLMALFGATEIYVWWTWRHCLGVSAAEAERIMRETIEALLAQWEEGRRKR